MTKFLFGKEVDIKVTVLMSIFIVYMENANVWIMA